MINVLEAHENKLLRLELTVFDGLRLSTQDTENKPYQHETIDLGSYRKVHQLMDQGSFSVQKFSVH